MKNFQTLKPKIADLLKNSLQNYDLKLYEINNFKDFGNDILQILVESASQPNKALDLDLLVVVSEEVSRLLDELVEIKDHYFLEVAGAGVEKKIRDENELIQALGSYVHCEFKKAIEKHLKLEGTLKTFDSQTKEFRMEFFNKGQPKKVPFTWEMVKNVRYAVKF